MWASPTSYCGDAILSGEQLLAAVLCLSDRVIGVWPSGCVEIEGCGGVADCARKGFQSAFRTRNATAVE